MNKSTNTCNCSLDCSCECPETINCPLDDSMDISDKNRTVSRKRHHSSAKERVSAKKNLKIVKSKAEKLPENATWDAHSRASKKCKNAEKRVHESE